MITKPHSIAPWIKFDEKYWFDPKGYRGCRKRVEPPRVHVGHWTGSKGWTRTYKNVYNALRGRKPSPLSIHFVLDANGDVWQQADCEKTVCFHAGAVNEFSVGTEIISPGLWRADLDPKDFTKYSCYVHGRLVHQVQYLPVQIDAYVRLCDTLHEKLGIKLQVPASADDKVLTEVMLSSQRQAFEGNVEHLHVASKKLDGGTQLSQALVNTGRYKLVRP